MNVNLKFGKMTLNEMKMAEPGKAKIINEKTREICKLVGKEIKEEKNSTVIKLIWDRKDEDGNNLTDKAYFFHSTHPGVITGKVPADIDNDFTLMK